MIKFHKVTNNILKYVCNVEGCVKYYLYRMTSVGIQIIKLLLKRLTLKWSLTLGRIGTVVVKRWLLCRGCTEYDIVFFTPDNKLYKSLGGLMKFYAKSRPSYHWVKYNLSPCKDFISFFNNIENKN
jgi:hypothetical protein